MTQDAIGERFARAIARQDSPGLHEVLAPEIDFRALTPGRFWETSSPTELVDDFILGTWFGPTDHIEELEDVEVGTIADRDRVAYRLRIANPDGLFLVEQQAYYEIEDDRISWLRIMCSGFRVHPDAAADSLR